MNRAGIEAIEKELGCVRDDLNRARHSKKCGKFELMTEATVDRIIAIYSQKEKDLLEALAEAMGGNGNGNGSAERRTKKAGNEAVRGM